MTKATVKDVKTPSKFVTKVIFIILVFVIILIASIFAYKQKTNKAKEYPPKEAQNSCVVGGCSEELCLEKENAGNMSICIYKDEFACLKFTECVKQSDGKCGWSKNEIYQKCMENPPKLNP